MIPYADASWTEDRVDVGPTQGAVRMIPVDLFPVYGAVIVGVDVGPGSGCHPHHARNVHP